MSGPRIVIWLAVCLPASYATPGADLAYGASRCPQTPKSHPPLRSGALRSQMQPSASPQSKSETAEFSTLILNPHAARFSPPFAVATFH
eukprot:3687338-Rhodomonas_salina.2